MFAFTDRRGRVEVAFTDRHGGVSPPPYDELDLSERCREQEPDVHAENLRRVLHALGGGAALTIAAMRQVHRDDVQVVDALPAGVPAGVPADGAGTLPACDGLVTRTPGIVLAARAADCVPLLLADPSAGVVAAVHAGRPGVEQDITSRALDALRAAGARDVTAWIGPRVCGSCYEVPADLQERVAAVEPATRATTSWGTPALDIAAGVAAQLGRRPEVGEVVDVGRCTREDLSLYSHRRDGARAGRHAGLVWLRPEAR